MRDFEKNEGSMNAAIVKKTDMGWYSNSRMVFGRRTEPCHAEPEVGGTMVTMKRGEFKVCERCLEFIRIQVHANTQTDLEPEYRHDHSTGYVLLNDINVVGNSSSNACDIETVSKDLS